MMMQVKPKRKNLTLIVTKIRERLQKAIPGGAVGLHKDLPEGGEWKTVSGHHIYIIDGKIVAGAVPGMTKDFKKMPKAKIKEYQDMHDGLAKMFNGDQEAAYGGKPKAKAVGPAFKPPMANKTKFHMKLYDGGYAPVEHAVKVEIPGHPEISTFIHKDENGYSVSEAKAGLQVSSGGHKTPQEAVDAAKTNFDKYGSAKIHELIDQAVSKNGLTPKYDVHPDGSIYDHEEDPFTWHGQELKDNKMKDAKAAPKTKPVEPKQKEDPSNEPEDWDDEYEDADTGEEIKVFHGTGVGSKNAILKDGFKVSRGLASDLGPCAYFKSPVFDQNEPKHKDRDTAKVVAQFSCGAVVKAFIPKKHLLDCTKGRPSELDELIQKITHYADPYLKLQKGIKYMTGKKPKDAEDAKKMYDALPDDKKWGNQQDRDDGNYHSIGQRTTPYELYCKKHGFKAVVDHLAEYSFEGWQIGVYDPSIIRVHDSGTKLQRSNGKLQLAKSMKTRKKGKSLPYCLIHHEITDEGLTMHVGVYNDKLQKSLASDTDSNIKQEEHAIRDYQEMLKVAGSDRIRSAIQEILDDEKDHKHNLECIKRYLAGDKAALKDIKKAVIMNLVKGIHKDLPDGGEWKTVKGRHIYVKDGKVLAGSIPHEGDVRKADHHELAASQEHLDKIQKKMDENPDGTSITPKGNTMRKKSGYMVAMTDNEMTGKKLADEVEKLRAFAKDHNLKEYFLGYWKDAHTGKEFLDVSVHVKEHRKAVELAKKHDQKAIWNIHDQQVEDTKEFDEKAGAYKSLESEPITEHEAHTLTNPCYASNSYQVAPEHFASGEIFFIPINRLKAPYQSDKALDFGLVYDKVRDMTAGTNISPIAIGYDHDILDGHHRVAASQIMQYTHVPCFCMGNNELAVENAKARYRDLWQRFVASDIPQPCLPAFKSLGGFYDIENDVWTITVEFGTKDFRSLCDMTKQGVRLEPI